MYYIFPFIEGILAARPRRGGGCCVCGVTKEDFGAVVVVPCFFVSSFSCVCFAESFVFILFSFSIIVLSEDTLSSLVPKPLKLVNKSWSKEHSRSHSIHQKNQTIYSRKKQCLAAYNYYLEGNVSGKRGFWVVKGCTILACGN